MRGIGEGACLRGRKGCWGSVWIIYVTSFCMMRWWTSGFRTFIPSNGTRSKVLTVIWQQLKVVDNGGRNHVLWFKAVPLKVNLSVWMLFLNRLANKDNLHRCHMANTNVLCLVGCDNVEDRDHLFFQCNFYGPLWYLTSGWLDITFVSQGELQAHSIQFGGLGGFSKNFRTTFNIVWISVLFTIWKDRNVRIFNNMVSSLLALLEKEKIEAFYWLKSNYIFFFILITLLEGRHLLFV